MNPQVSLIPILAWVAALIAAGMGGFIMWWVKRVANKVDKTEREFLEYKSFVLDKFATQDMLSMLKTEIKAEFSEFRRFFREDIDRLVEVIKHKE